MEQLFYLPSTMIWPLVACLVLTGIHVYLGVHVIARKVIFVDLALAQIAALGTVIGVLLGFEVGKDTTALYLYSLAFTIFGAFIFSATRMKGEKVPHEAIIGIIYAVTFATTILVLSKSALGPQELDHIIKGELLWVQQNVVVKTAVIYALVGVFHFIFRKKFMAISFDAAGAERSGMNVRLWDFLFYMSFGFVITSSVAIAGVFLVFSYLVIPSVGAMLLSEKLSTRLAIGWTAGSIISFIGVKLSWNTGLPTSPLIVVVLASALMLAGIFRYFKLTEKKLVALRNFTAALIVVGIFIGGVFYFKKTEESPLEHSMHMLHSPLGTDRQTALMNLASYKEYKAEWIAAVTVCLKDEDAEVRKATVDLLTQVRETSSLNDILVLISDKSDDVKKSVLLSVKTIGDSGAAGKMLEAAATEDDPEIKIQMIEISLELGDKRAIPFMIEMVKDGGLFAPDAYEHLRAHIDVSFTIKEITSAEQWWNKNRGKLKWDKSKNMFVIQ